MKRWFALAVVAAFAAACSDRPVPTQPGGPSFLDIANAQTHVHVMPPKALALGLGAAKPGGGKPGGGGKNGGTGILYHGGPIFFQTRVGALFRANSTLSNPGPPPRTPPAAPAP